MRASVGRGARGILSHPRMATLFGVLIDSGDRDLPAVLRALGVETAQPVAGHTCFVEVFRKPLLGFLPRWTPPDTAKGFAARASEVAGTAFLISAQTSADVYWIFHSAHGSLVRSVLFNRDAEEPWACEGQEQPWETELLFSQPVDEFLACLSDHETVSQHELDVARLAHLGRRLNMMTKRPPLTAAALLDWLKAKGIDPARPLGRVAI